MGEKSCKLCNQELNIYNIQTNYTTQQQKSQQPNWKVIKRPEKTFLQRRYIDGQQAHEKMHNITNYIREMQTKTTMMYHLTPV